MSVVSKKLSLLVGLGAMVSAQSLTEAAAAAAGGTVGGAAGKPVSQGVVAIFSKVDKQTAKAASTSDSSGPKSKPERPSQKALIEAGPGAPESNPSHHSAGSKVNTANTLSASAPTRAGEPVTVPVSAWDDVPPPPPLPKHLAPLAKQTLLSPPVQSPLPRPASLPPPPPPQSVTLQELKTIETGMTRSDLLKLGQPSARITMFENGGLLEIYSYHSHDAVSGDRPLATVQLKDGTVSHVELRN